MDRDVLLSFASHRPWMDRYATAFGRLLIDSGAFTEMNTGKKVDLSAYRDWSDRWRGNADAIAGLDDIGGDWKRSMANYAAIPWSFPTIHDTDPIEVLPELVAMALERGTWLGIGLEPPRSGKEDFVRDVLDRLPYDLHVHGWALCRYSYLRRIDSVDSTTWWREAMKLRQRWPWLHYGEALDIAIKRQTRLALVDRQAAMDEDDEEPAQQSLALEA